MEDLIKIKNMKHRRFFKHAARHMLYSDWLCHVFAYIVVGAFFVGVNNFGSSASLVISELTENIRLSVTVLCTFMLLSVFLVIPLLYGLVYFEINAIKNDKGQLTDIFYAYSGSEIMFRAYTLFLKSFFGCLLCFLPSIVVYIFKDTCYDSMTFAGFQVAGIDVVSFLLNSAFVIALYLGFVFASSVFQAIYITVVSENRTVDECFYLSRRALKNSRAEFGKTALSFFPLFAISLFSIGFLFVLYTIPYMSITFVMYSKYFFDKYLYEIKNNNNQK